MRATPARTSTGALVTRALGFLVALCIAAPAAAEPPPAREILERVEDLIWGRTVQGEYEMTIATPRWQRTLALRAWMERPRRSFVRILAPAKEKGIGSLRIGSEMWNYLPNVERTIKIPPSMMLQPWMGSDLTNDDLVKSSSIVDDYTHRMLREEDGAWLLELLPKPESAVVWGKILYWVRKGDFVPLKEEFYDERGTLVRTMTFSEVKPVGGRSIPTRWQIRPADKPGNSTTFVIRSAVYDRPIDPEVFTQRNLQKP